MPEWNDAAREMAFASNEAYIQTYCRPGKISTLNGIQNDDANRNRGITERREISRWLSVAAPHAVHRTLGHTGRPRPWLHIGKINSRDGDLRRNSFIAIFFHESSHWIGFPNDKNNKDLLIAEELKGEGRKFVSDGLAELTKSVRHAIIEKSYRCWALNDLSSEAKGLIEKVLATIDSEIFILPPNKNAAQYQRDNADLGPVILMPSARTDANANMSDSSNVKKESQKKQPPGAKMPKIPLNVILYGPPGTGKTFATLGLALSCCVGDSDERVKTFADKCITGEYASPPDEMSWKEWLDRYEKLRNSGRIEFTTFHQNYAYEDFVEGIRPQVENGVVKYATEPGIFKKIAYRALYAWLKGDGTPCPIGDDTEEGAAQELVRRWLKDGSWGKARTQNPSDEKAPAYVLIIDEINRGNIARILGELITLLEGSKRARHRMALGDQPLKVTLPYTRDLFIVPPNLHIIGTMNTADRSLIGLDIALRRRFQFVELPPRPEALSSDVGGVNLRQFLTVLNERIESHLDADHSIGHALFAGLESIGQIQDAMIQKVIPLLREYFHDRPEALRAVLEVEGRDHILQFTGQDRSLRFKGVNREALGSPETYRLFIGVKAQ